MLLPDPKDPSLVPIFSFHDPAEIGVHAVRCGKNGAFEGSPVQFAHWNGMKWGPVVDTAELARPASRGRNRLTRLQHCRHWRAVRPSKGKAKTVESATQAQQERAADHSSIDPAIESTVTSKPEKVQRVRATGQTQPEALATNKTRRVGPHYEEVRDCIMQLTADQQVHHIDSILAHIVDTLGESARQFVDVALTELMHDSKLKGMSGLCGSGHQIFFSKMIVDEDPLASQDRDATEVATPEAVTGSADSHVSSEAPREVTTQALAPTPTPAPIRSFVPRTRSSVVESSVTNRVIDAALIAVFNLGPLTFGRVLDYLQDKYPELEVTGDSLNSMLRIGMMRGLLEFTDKFTGAELRYTLGQFGESTPRGWRQEAVHPETLLHALLETLYVCGGLDAAALTRRAANLLPRDLVTEAAVIAALAQAIADGNIRCDGKVFWLAGQKVKPSFIIERNRVTIVDGAEKIVLDEEATNELRRSLGR